MIKGEIKNPNIIFKPSEDFSKLIKQLKEDAKANEVTDELALTKTEETFLKRINPKFESYKPPNEEPITPQILEGKAVLDTRSLKVLLSLSERRRESTSKTVPYIHELLRRSTISLPQNEYLERNPVLEARCQKLRRENEQRIYEKMTKNVDNVRKPAPEESIGSQIKMINRQLIAVAQFIFSVLAGFAFGFIGIELLVGNLDFGFRLLLGISISLVVALAEIYFLAKKLNEDYEEQPTPKKVPDIFSVNKKNQ